MRLACSSLPTVQTDHLDVLSPHCMGKLRPPLCELGGIEYDRGPFSQSIDVGWAIEVDESGVGVGLQDCVHCRRWLVVSVSWQKVPEDAETVPEDAETVPEDAETVPVTAAGPLNADGNDFAGVLWADILERDRDQGCLHLSP